MKLNNLKKKKKNINFVECIFYKNIKLQIAE